MIVVFPDYSFLIDIAKTPGGVEIGKPICCIDGRVAVEHNFSQEDIDFFLDMPGVQVVEQLPGDWHYQIGEP